jgi:hypothetical protein
MPLVSYNQSLKEVPTAVLGFMKNVMPAMFATI